MVELRSEVVVIDKAREKGVLMGLLRFAAPLHVGYDSVAKCSDGKYESTRNKIDKSGTSSYIKCIIVFSEERAKFVTTVGMVAEPRRSNSCDIMGVSQTGTQLKS